MQIGARHLLALSSFFSALVMSSGCSGGGVPPAISAGNSTVTLAPSGLTYSTNPAVYTKGAAISDNRPSSNGGAVLSYLVSPALPSGLNFDTTTGVISGRPSSTTPRTNYTVTATNSGGSATAIVNIAVNDVPTSTAGSIFGSLTPSTFATVVQSIELGLKFKADVNGFVTGVRYYKDVNNTGTHTGSLWSSTGMLLATTTFSSETASGWQSANFASPVAISANTVYVISYHTDTGHYAGDTGYFSTSGVDNGVLHALAGAAGGGNGVFRLGPTGFPSSVNNNNNYWVDVVFSTASPASSGLTYSVNPAVYTKGVTIASNIPSSLGGSVTSYSVSPVLPAGLSLNPTTGAISGTPSVVSVAANYMVTAARPAGSTMVAVNITVNDVAPSGLTYSANPAVYTKGAAISNNRPSSTGGAVLSYSVSPALPSGLTFDTTTGVISGTPSSMTPATNYTVTATNSGGSATAVVNITVNDVVVPAGPQFYVATSGNDSSPGTAAQPWRTIQKAMSSATPGSTVNIGAGTYPERLNVLVSGTPGNYIAFQPSGFSSSPNCGGYTGVACAGDRVILDYSSFGTVTDGVPYLTIYNQSYVRIQGLTFQNYQVLGAMQRGGQIFGSSNHIEFKYNKVLNIQNNGPWNGQNALLGFWVEPPAHDVWFYGNEIGGIVANYGEALTTASSNVTIENNWMHDVDGIGIALAQNSSNTIVRGNLLEWISKKRDGSIWYNNPSNAIYVNGGNTAIIERNTVRDSAYGYAVVTEPGYPYTHDVVIRNNLAYRNANAGIMLGNWYSNTDGSSVYNIKVLNNTVYSCSIGFLVRPYVSASVAWENNLIAGNSTALVNTLGWPLGTMDYNLYFGGGAGPDAHKVTLDPQFTNPGAGDLTLQAGSPAIGAGDPGTSPSDVGSVDFAGLARFLSGRIDIGAFQRQ